jgi:hypothetical protein
VAECVFELDSENSAPYLLLSNIYAAAGRWDDIQKIRKMMKDRGVKRFLDAVGLRSISRCIHSLQETDLAHEWKKSIWTWRECVMTQRWQGIFVVQHFC